MEEIYVYRNHLKKIQKGIIFVGLPISILLVILGIFMESSFFIIFAVFMSIYDVFIFKTYDRFTKAKFILNDDGIVLMIKDKVKENIKYHEITKVKSKSMNYTGGWLLIYGNNKKPLRLMVTIKDVGLMIKRIKAELDALNKFDVYQEEKLNKFFKTAYYADQSWQRASYYMPRFFILLIIQVILAIILSIINDHEYIAALFILAMIIDLIGYIYVEYFIYVKAIKKQSDHNDWQIIDYDVELGIQRFRKVLIIDIVITVIFVIVSFII